MYCAAKAPLQDVVPVSDNPAYQMVIIQRINRSDESQLKELKMASAGQSTDHTLPQYENIHIKPKENNNSSCDEDDYEKVK